MTEQAQAHKLAIRKLARQITIVENELSGHLDLLSSLKINQDIPVTGFTGPPGAGKSTLVNAFIQELRSQGLHVGILAIDPSSPFNFGALLGDRIRLDKHFNDGQVYIRSLATRGSLGGLSNKVIEVTDVLRSHPFDHIIIETVGVGQSEVDIAGLADTTVIVLVPESGDEVQTLKAGIMEIGNIFVVNKSDREGADNMMSYLEKLVKSTGGHHNIIPVIKTIATQGEGVEELTQAIIEHHKNHLSKDLRLELLSRKFYKLIQAERMQGIHLNKIKTLLSKEILAEDFNIYRLIQKLI